MLLQSVAKQLFEKMFFDLSASFTLGHHQAEEIRIVSIWCLKWLYCLLGFFWVVTLFSLRYRSFCFGFRIAVGWVTFFLSMLKFKSFSLCFSMNFLWPTFWLNFSVWLQFFLSFHTNPQSKLFQTQSSFFLLHSCTFKTFFCPCLHLLNHCPSPYRSFYHFHFKPLKFSSSHYWFTFWTEYRTHFLSYFLVFNFSWFLFLIRILCGLKFCQLLCLWLKRFGFCQFFEDFIFSWIPVGFSCLFCFDFYFSSFSSRGFSLFSLMHTHVNFQSNETPLLPTPF